MHSTLNNSPKWSPTASRSEFSPQLNRQISQKYSEDAAKVLRSISLEGSRTVNSSPVINLSSPVTTPRSASSLNPLGVGTSPNRGNKFSTQYKHVTFKSDSRILFPGEKRQKSAASLLANLKSVQRKPRQPAEQIEDEIILQRRVSQCELEDIVARLGQPTASSFMKIRSEPVRKVSFRLPNRESRYVTYFQFDSGRFKGLRKVSFGEMENITSRLSAYKAGRIPESRGEVCRISELRVRNPQKKLITDNFGLTNNYKVKGVKNY